MTISQEEVLRVARLARLDLEPDEIESLGKELGRILDYVSELSALDTSQVEPTAHVVVEALPLRQDEHTPGLGHDEALREAPRSTGGGFAVPGFVDDA